MAERKPVNYYETNDPRRGHPTTYSRSRDYYTHENHSYEEELHLFRADLKGRREESYGSKPRDYGREDVGRSERNRYKPYEDSRQRGYATSSSDQERFAKYGSRPVQYYDDRSRYVEQSRARQDDRSIGNRNSTRNNDYRYERKTEGNDYQSKWQRKDKFTSRNRDYSNKSGSERAESRKSDVQEEQVESTTTGSSSHRFDINVPHVEEWSEDEWIIPGDVHKEKPTKELATVKDDDDSV